MVWCPRDEPSRATPGGCPAGPAPLAASPAADGQAALRGANAGELAPQVISLLDDDEEIWEDFSDDEPLEDILDDESAGDLFMRFEEKHTLNNSVDGSN